MPLSTPKPDQIRAAWARVFAAPHVKDGLLGILLDGLPLIAAGRVCDDTGQAMTLARVADRAAAHEPAADWQAEGRPFLAELARRVLALGHLQEPDPEADSLLCPQLSHIDPDCADAPLALARAVTAVELHHGSLLATVVARHLRWRTRLPTPEPLLPWLAPLLEDEVAQCLLTASLAGGEPGRGDATELSRILVAVYGESRDRTGGLPPGWPAGPLTSCCALGLLLRRPREAVLLAEFRSQVEGWPGWQDEDRWPTRHPGTDLNDLKNRLTERIGAALGVGQRKPWPRAALAARIETSWPPLLSFGFSTPLPPARGERDEPHP
jgi:hypothetical protein